MCAGQVLQLFARARAYYVTVLGNCFGQLADGQVCGCADASHPGHKQVEEVLGSVGFTETMQAQPVASLSGGWKMKLALARAMLMKADIMLLDEPTNHLDVKNVKWLQDYLISLTVRRFLQTNMLVRRDGTLYERVTNAL